MTAEHRRLDEARERSVPWKAWGPYLSERQWGTVREDYSEGGDSWNYFTHDQARSRAYRWGEDGLAGISDEQSAALLRAGPLEREGPDPQGAPLRPDQQREQPRGGRQGVLLLPRQHPDPFVHEVPLQVPAGGVPLQRPGRDQPTPGAERAGVRADRHGDLRGGSLLGRVRRVRQEHARRRPHPDQRAQPGPRGGRASRPADALVPQPVVLAGPRRPPGDAGNPRSGGSRRPGHRRRDRRAVPRLRGGRPPALHRERDEHAADLRRPEPDPVRQGQHQRLRRARRAGPAEPGADRDQGGRPLSPDGRARRVRDDPVAPLRRRPDGRGPGQRERRGALRRRLRRGLPGAAGRGGRVLRRRHPALAGRRRGRRDAAGPGGDALVQAVLPLRRRQVAGGARVRPVQADAEGRPAQRALAPHVQRRRHLDARQVGIPLVRGLGPRLPRPRPDARRPRFRQAPAQADAARAVHAPQRPDPGLRVEFRRRQPAGPRLVDHLHLPPRSGGARRGGPGVAQELLPEAPAELHLVGQPQGPHGPERLRGRLPGPRQHRRLRPQRAPADRRLPRAGRRHRLDGPLLPEHAGDRRRAGDDRPPTTARWR